MSLLVVVIAAPALLPVASPVHAQAYPVKPIRLIVPLAPGGNLDLNARTVAQQMNEGLGQRIVVENRPGTSSLVGTQLVARSAPDGYTLLAMANTFATVPLFVANPGYDAVKDFAPISMTARVAQALVVNSR